MTILRPTHPIGYIHSAQGLKGELFIALKAVDESWLDSWEELILSPRIDGKDAASLGSVVFTTFTIESLRVHKKQGKLGVVVSVNGVRSMTEAEQYVSHTVWIPEEFLESKPGEKIFLKEIEGFFVVDSRRGSIGPIINFSSNGAQDLIEVEYNGQSYYVPLVEAFIDKLDKKNRKIFMSIPEGLLE
jgi:16S rRNA processing protein RimM